MHKCELKIMSMVVEFQPVGTTFSDIYLARNEKVQRKRTFTLEVYFAVFKSQRSILKNLSSNLLFVENMTFRISHL